MHCDEIQKLMMAYITGDLPDITAGQFERHLDVCPWCRGEYADEVEMVAAFDINSKGLADGYFVTDVMGAIDTALKFEYARLRVNPVQRGVVFLGILWLLIVVFFLWKVNWAPFSSTAITGRYLAQAELAAGEVLAAVSITLAGMFEAVQSVYRSALAFFTSFTSDYTATIAIITALSAIACVSLIGGFRRKLAKEQKI